MNYRYGWGHKYHSRYAEDAHHQDYGQNEQIRSHKQDPATSMGAEGGRLHKAYDHTR